MTRHGFLQVRFLLTAIGVLVGLSVPPSVLLAQQVSTTVQLPTFGISVDAQGVLSVKSFVDRGGEFQRLRQAALAGLPGDVAQKSALRTISLRRLEKAVAARLEAGQELTEEMRYLAGLQRAEFVFIDPQRQDILLAGAAAGWMQDLSGRVVGVDTLTPVLELEDLLVALRAYPPGAKPPPLVGCTIDPTPDGLAKLQQFQRQIPRSVRPQQRAQVAQFVANGVRDSLGMAQIRVFGVPPDTHFAHVLIEADYRMKRIGIGLEPTPIKLASYMDLLSSGVARHGTLQRWWFTPNYQCVRVSEDRLAMQLVGEGVQLLSEDKLIEAGGRLAAAGASNKASELFTLGFTRKYPDLAAKSPVFAQLRNLIDLCVAAAFLQQQDAYGQVSWNMPILGSEEVLSVRGKPSPQQVAAAVNSAWKGNRLLAPAGGGVEIHAEQALLKENLQTDQDGKLRAVRDSLSVPQEDVWWWD